MQPVSLEHLTQAVVDHGDGGATNPRLYEIYTSLIKHLHAFVREVNLTESELQLGRDFLRRASQHTQEIPSGEVHMLTDLLGLSALVDVLHDTDRGAATESNLEGPIYLADAPERRMGDRLGIDEDGEALFISGRVLDTAGRPLAGALIDVWQPNSKGLYDVQDPGQPQGNFRGRFKTDAQGRYAFETVVPLGYHVPSSGPCGELLQLLGRHSWRAAHIHFKLSAAGYRSLTTQLYIAGDPHIDSDTTFSVKSAIVQLHRHSSPGEIGERQRDQPFYTTTFDFVLKPALETSEPSPRPLPKEQGGVAGTPIACDNQRQTMEPGSGA